MEPWVSATAAHHVAHNSELLHMADAVRDFVERDQQAIEMKPVEGVEFNPVQSESTRSENQSYGARWDA